MESTLKLFLYTFLWASVLLGCSPKPSQSFPDTKEEVSNLTRWRMVWVNDFGQQNLQHEGLAPFLDNFIRLVTIHTELEDGQPMTTRLSSGCNYIKWNTYKRIVTPVRTVETYRDGKLHYDTIPATYETHSDWYNQTQKTCFLRREIDGKAYSTSWYMTMEKFLMENGRNAAHSHKGDKLEWIDAEGSIIARFEKLPDIFIDTHFWKLDPIMHTDDPILAQYFGPAKLFISFPDFRYYRPCDQLSARVKFTGRGSQLFGDVVESSVACEDLSYLVDGQRYPYTPGNTAPNNLLARYLPEVTQYELKDDAYYPRQLTLSDEDGKPLLHLISVTGFWSEFEAQTHIYDQLDNHEWIIEPTANVTPDVISATSPIRIYRHHHGYKSADYKGHAKMNASIITAQDCVVYGLKVNGRNQSMTRLKPRLKAYNKCDSSEVSKFNAEFVKAKKFLFDDTYLIFYDEDWNEVMRTRRGKSIEASEDQ